MEFKSIFIRSYSLNSDQFAPTSPRVLDEIGIDSDRSAFTLIETLLYIGLFTLIIGGTLSGAYQIIEGSDRLTAKTELQEEANFMLRKIDWALINGTILSPAVNSTSSILRINKSGFASNPLEFTMQSNNLELSHGGVSQIVNSSFIKVEGVMFEHIVGTTSLGRVLKTTLTLNGESFTTTKHLPK